MGGREGSRPTTNRRKTAARKDGLAASEATSSPEPLWTVNPTDPSGAVAETVESREDRLPHITPHGSANHSIHHYSDAYRDNKETNTLRLGTSGDQSGRAATNVNTKVVQPSPTHQSAYHSHMATHPASPPRFIQRGNVEEADFDKLAETHSECEETVGKLVQARLDLTHSSHLYTTLFDRYKTVNKDKALRIKELEDELARKDSALVYAKRLNSKRAQKKEKLVAQFSKTEMEKFDCILGWGKGLSEERSEEDLLELMCIMENFDAYTDKKMCVEYDKLFEKRYPYVEKVSHGFLHFVSDLLKVYPDSPPSGQAPPSNPFSKKDASTSAL
ncbi:hypothetical protein Tco_0495995 [Tanacetum coccineum]